MEEIVLIASSHRKTNVFFFVLPTRLRTCIVKWKSSTIKHIKQMKNIYSPLVRGLVLSQDMLRHTSGTISHLCLIKYTRHWYDSNVVNRRIHFDEVVYLVHEQQIVDYPGKLGQYHSVRFEFKISGHILYCNSPKIWIWLSSWWRHQMETFSALLALCEGNPLDTAGFPSQNPVTRSFDVLFDLRMNEWLSKQSRRRWFETPSHLWWRHCNDHVHNW